MSASDFSIVSERTALSAELELPPAGAAGVIVFSHGSGSNRSSRRNQFVADELRRAGFATLLFDLLTPAELEDADRRYDFRLLTRRLSDAVRFVATKPETRDLPVGLFGASTGVAAVLRVAADMPEKICAVVSRGGRPDFAGRAALSRVRAATLLIVGGEDHGVMQVNKVALDMLGGPRELALVPGATHVFAEEGAIEQVASLAADWFGRCVPLTRPTAVPL